MANSEIIILAVVAVLLIAIGVVAYVLTLPPVATTTPAAGSGETIDTAAEAFNPLGSDAPMTNPNAGSPPVMPSLPG